MAVTAAIIGAVAAVGAVAYSVYAGNKQEAAMRQQAYYQQQARQKSQQLAEQQNRQRKIQLIRNARLASAQTRQMAVNQGAATSSSVQAASSNPFVQAGANIGFMNTEMQLMRERNANLSTATVYGNQASRWGTRMNTAGAVGGLGSQIWNASGGAKAFA